MVIEFISLLLTMAAFLVLKRMMGALAPFSYLVYYNLIVFKFSQRCIKIFLKIANLCLFLRSFCGC